jgi:hypothetical protein
VAVEVEFVQLEVGAERLELVDEAVRAPQRRIVGPVGRAAAELVVEDDAPVRARKALERLQVKTAAPGTAVQEHERSVAVAEDPVADGSPLDLHCSTLLLHVSSSDERGGPEEPPRHARRMLA